METAVLTNTLRTVLLTRMKEFESRGGGQVLVQPPVCKILVEGKPQTAWFLDLERHTLEAVPNLDGGPPVGGVVALSARAAEQMGKGELDVRTALEDRAIQVSGDVELLPYLDALFAPKPLI